VKILGVWEDGKVAEFTSVISVMKAAQDDLSITAIKMLLPSGEELPLEGCFENSRRSWKVADSFLAKIRFWESEMPLPG